MHITSLPGGLGVGDLGGGARSFVDFLFKAGQRVWQVLPLGPTIHGDSPYSCYSAFAGNPMLVSMEDMVTDGWLEEADVRDVAPVDHSSLNPWQADYGLAYDCKSKLLEIAYQRFRSDVTPCSCVDGFEEFCTRQRWWLDDFSLFAALMHEHGTDDWTSWDPGETRRDAGALSQARQRLSQRVEYEQFVQFMFFTQWNRLREYARRKGVKMFGDMPIFVAHGSADVWANQSAFELKSNGRPRVVAGVPPDYFSKTGQLWGNPLYNWEQLAEVDFHWWTQRFRMAFELYDLLRIDHFRGFEAYWEVSAEAKTAVSGNWVKGPGRAPFDAAARSLGPLPIIAEDLGMITDEVHRLREDLAFPGMRVAQFGFDSDDDLFHRPETYPEDSAAYTGTHDNSTIVGWLEQREDRTEDSLRRYLEGPSSSSMPYHWQLISMVMRSRSVLAIIPMQDVLGLDDGSRMNIPGKASGNWGWRCPETEFTDEIADRLHVLSVASDRAI
ncbi:MAG TPA: 4-alpha-glucanotransferase [Planctomycetaceae bacterium]|nr:4-alpha-glucanotransferase [Planctomycetaceae bacterium]